MAISYKELGLVNTRKMFADAVDESQPAFFQGDFQLLLPHLVLFSAQLLIERIPGGDVRRTKGIAVRHQLFKVRARLANVHREGGSW